MECVYEPIPGAAFECGTITLIGRRKMSTPAILFGIYFGIGLFLMIVALATPGKEKRAKGFDVFGGYDGIDTGLLIFIALLWPIWLLSMLTKKDPPAKL